MGKLVMCSYEYDETSLEILISDVQRIKKVPENIKEVIKENWPNRRLTKSGLPSVLYLGEEQIRVVGAFKYGDVAFAEIEGKWSKIEQLDQDGFMVITAYRENKTYEELKEGKREYLDSISDKMKNGVVVE